ncbi:Uncharacterised protein [Achromobacter denitrificans]|jgi:hypothetical protein|nr:hypothetical protein LMG1231_02560 [Achromobacter denitrificans]SUU25615.1 Uncharacterised protein [Achromobacter denitrificans]
MRFGGDLARSFAFSGRRICLAMSVLALGGCADLSAVGRDMMSKPYDAPTARAEAARVDPSPLRDLFPDMTPPVRAQEKGTYLRYWTAFNWSLAFSSRLSIAAAPMCWGGLYEFNGSGETTLMRYSMELDRGKAKWEVPQVNWVAPYAAKVDGSRAGDVWLSKEVIARLPADDKLAAHQARLASLDEKRFGGVLRDGEYAIAEKRGLDLRICRFSVHIVEDQIGFPALVRHRSDITGVPSSTMVYERVFEVFPRDEELQWFFAQEYASGIVFVNFGGSERRDLRKRFSAAVDGAVARMARADNIDPDRVEDKVFRRSAYPYYLAVYIGHNAGLDIDDYLASLRIDDAQMLVKVDPKAVEYRERLLRHWWDELRAQHAAGTLVKPDPLASAAALERL